MNILWMVGAFALILTPIIFVHELGHFVAARFFDIRVEEFGIGFPPRAVKLFERKGTIYSLNWIPLGGFVRPAGEDDPSVPDGLAAAPKKARFFTLAAGAAANFVLAFFVFWIAFMIGPSAVAVEDVQPGSPALAAGLQSGDLILEVNDQLVESSGVLVTAVTEHAGQSIELVVQRGEDVFSVNLVPRREGEYDPQTEGPMGISLGYGRSSRLAKGPVESVTSSVRSIGEIIYLTVRAPIMLLEGEITPAQARPVGPVGISQIAGQTAQYTAATGDWFQLLRITAFISVALGFTNLLPIPALDGGRILFVLLEAIRGRRIEPEREGLVHLVGMLFLLGLMFLLIIQDISNPIIQ
ncbi:MAG TPA: M50 family metallopeptidase [Candidatus Binatia bacterium]|nr:M50 family metallopeptidase [Candidatus Binatia bacterium]